MKSIVIVACSMFALATFACHPTEDGTDTSDGGVDAATGSLVACYVSGQMICDEYPHPTSDQSTNAPVACSSNSGVYGASCPMAGFGGRCTLGGTGTGEHIQRFYTGSDLAYDQDFCVNTAHGVWSTTF